MNIHDLASDHRRAWDGMPWLVAGSLDADEQAWLTLHLARCEDCRAELHFQQQVQAGLRAATASAPTPDTANPEPGLQRLLARIDAAEHTDAARAVADARRPERRPAPWTRWLLAAVVLQAVGLGAAGLALRDQARGRDGDYRTLSQPPSPAQPATLRLVPAPSLDMAALRVLLAQTQTALVEVAPDGSAYGLVAQDGKPETVAAAVQRLRGWPGVLMAEPTGHAR